MSFKRYNGHKVIPTRTIEERIMRGSVARKDNANECIYDMAREGWTLKRAMLEPGNEDVLELLFERPARA